MSRLKKYTGADYISNDGVNALQIFEQISREISQKERSDR